MSADWQAQDQQMVKTKFPGHFSSKMKDVSGHLLGKSVSCHLLGKSVSGHLLGKSCSLGLPYFPFAICLFVILVLSHFGFNGMILVKIVPVPGHYLLLTFIQLIGPCINSHM